MRHIVKILLLLLLTNSAMASQKVTVILDWFVNPDHAPLFVAQEQGYFKQQGLDVNIIAPANPNDGPKLIAAGKADIAINYQSGLLQQVDQGLPLMRVGTLFPENLNAIAVLKDSTIHRLTDLKGKKIGISSGDVDQAMIGVMLQHVGLSIHDVTLVNVNYNLVQALLTKQVDAVSGIMCNVEPIEMELLGHPARVFYPQDYGVPDSDSEIWVINRRNAKQPWVKKFLTAVQQGTVYLQQHPEATWKQFAAAHPEVNTPFNERSWMTSYKLFTADPWTYNPKKYQAYAEFMQQQGLIKKVPPLKQYVA